jgi:hypothetical protein
MDKKQKEHANSGICLCKKSLENELEDRGGRGNVEGHYVLELQVVRTGGSNDRPCKNENETDQQ